MKTLKILAVVGALLVLANSQSKAEGIILNPGSPDLTGSFMDVTYDAGTSAFEASGWTSDYQPSGSLVGSGFYTVMATITNEVLHNGTLNIYGDVGSGDNLLLSGNLTPGGAGIAFGYGDGGNELFQFRYTVTGGTLADDFGGNGAAGGIILTAWFSSNAGNDNPFTGSWASSFDNLYDGAAYTGTGDINSFMIIPEPGALALMVCGLTGLLVMRRRSAMKSAG